MLILGGGSPKNFLLQTEPQIQEVLGIAEKGHDYFLAVHRRAPRHRRPLGRDARRGGDAGARSTPTSCRARSICYTDSTIALPLLTAYALAQHAPRRRKRLYDRRGDMMTRLKDAYFEHGRANEGAAKG